MPFPKPGTIGFAHTTGAMGKLIRVGEFVRGCPGSEWNHAFVISDKISAEGEPYVIQATLEGVTDTKRFSEIAPGGIVGLSVPPNGVSMAKVVEFAQAQVGIEYGFLTIAAIATDIVTADWVPAFQGSRNPSWICSALAAESLRYGGWLHGWINVYTVTPQDLWEAMVPPARSKKINA